jgi:phosphohistidine phosphatase SixA
LRFLAAFLLAALALPSWAQADAALLQALRKGGYVLYMRHSITDMSQNDAKMKDYDDCANQRNLTGDGRAQARAIGAQVKRLGIPVGIVLASPYCRTMETARLAFGPAPVTATEELRGGPGTANDPKRYAPLKELLSSPMDDGRNMVAVSHGNPFYALAGAPYLAEGEIAVVKPAGTGFSVVGRIRPEQWPALGN